MSIACPACTFLNHPSLSVCEICSTPLPRVKHSSERSFSAKSAPASRPRSPDDETVPRMIKISFRKGGDKAFYSALKRSLKGKAWENNERGTPSERHATTRSGINGILRVVESSAQNRENDLQDSLQDLEALMNKAKEMVRLAADLNEKLTASASSGPSASPLNTSINSDSSALVPVTEPEEATFIRSSLAQLGLQMANTPVTLDMMKDDRKWFDELARELAGILQGSSRSGNGSTGTGLLGERGILPLDEVWGGWNRARGVALIPPSTFLQVIPLLSSYTDPPIRRRTFASGLSVLHTPPFTDAAFAARLSGLLALSGPKTTIEVAQEEKMAVGLATEMIDAVEQGGYICRDDAQAKISGSSGGGAELRWWANIFEGYSWDGQSDISQA
ncbi:Vacuolar protein-sorting-associated protein 36 [Pleurotus ostreatus]|nr:Vacuolar protein-sorting-associated protein 36 [Pleurotus ostreatus]